MKFLYFFASRMAWFCAMICMAIIGLFSPDLLMSILDQFATDRAEKKKGS